MRLVHWTGLLLLLLVGGVFFWLRLQVPLRVPLFGYSLPVEGLWLLGFGLGVVFSGLYLVAFGLKGLGEKRRLLREIRRLKEEMGRLEASRIAASPSGEHRVEVPRIPDRDT